MMPGPSLTKIFSQQAQHAIFFVSKLSCRTVCECAKRWFTLPARHKIKAAAKDKTLSGNLLFIDYSIVSKKGHTERLAVYDIFSGTMQEMKPHGMLIGAEK
jgi:hypothetical protein